MLIGSHGIGAYGATSVTTTAAQIGAAASRRSSLIVFNNSAAAVFIGTDANVTTANGLPIPAGVSISFDDYSGPVWAVVAAGTADVRWLGVGG